MHLYLKWAAQSRALESNREVSWDFGACCCSWCFQFTVDVLQCHGLKAINAPLVPRANNTKVQMLVDDEFCIKTMFRHGGNVNFASSQQEASLLKSMSREQLSAASNHNDGEWSMKHVREVCFKSKLPSLLHFKSQTGFWTKVLHMKH